jgi:hypothetical protein
MITRQLVHQNIVNHKYFTNKIWECIIEQLRGFYKTTTPRYWAVQSSRKSGALFLSIYRRRRVNDPYDWEFVTYIDWRY